MTNKQSLQKVFNSYFHNKYTFDDFCTLDTNAHYKEIFYSKNTFSPSPTLKEFQKFLNLFVFEKLSINQNVVFSYRKGLNVKDAILPHS
ncbi:MAG TPA: RNA-directed DNA polymerase, partial [Bacteroidetes bacterium]|nr:RNA-directed DNA polymerase [Bacteroidota bacterium]